MEKFMKFCAVAVVISVLSGCVVHVGDRDRDDKWNETEKLQVRNQDYINQLQLGMTSTAVRSGLGAPDFVEYVQKNGDNIEVLFYRTHRSKGDGITTKDECTALVFRQGNLVGWGEKAYQNL